MAVDPPLGYSNHKLPESFYDTYRSQVVDKAVSITKSAVQGYIQKFLHPAGEYRGFLKTAVSPEGLQYVTELTFDEEMKTNPNLRKTYLAKFFAENVGKIPSILIVDQGFVHVDSGINELIDGRIFQGVWRGRLAFIGKVSLSIMTTTYSEEETNVLSGIVVFIFTSMINAINNGVIRDPNSKWEVRVPLTDITAGQPNNVPVEGDTKSQVWMRSTDLTFDFETVVSIELPVPTVLGPTLLPADVTPRLLNLVPNQTIALGSPYQLLTQYVTINHELTTSDPNVAVVTRTPPYILQPIRQGKCLLYIRQINGDVTPEPVTDRAKNLVISVPFRVSI